MTSLWHARFAVTYRYFKTLSPNVQTLDVQSRFHIMKNLLLDKLMFIFSRQMKRHTFIQNNRYFWSPLSSKPGYVASYVRFKRYNSSQVFHQNEIAPLPKIPHYSFLHPIGGYLRQILLYAYMRKWKSFSSLHIESYTLVYNIRTRLLNIHGAGSLYLSTCCVI